MGLTRGEMRQQLAERLLAALGPAGWSESLYHADLLGKDSRSRTHLAFAISIGSTQRFGTPKPADGAHVNTAILVRWIHQLRAGGAGGQVADYDAALVAEQALLVAAVAEGVRPELSIWFDGADEPKVTADGAYVVGGVRFIGGDILPLTT